MTTNSTDNSEQNPAIENIGETLRLAREERGMTTSAAAMQTNLTQHIIEHLENNAFRQIGAPVFTRGYLISYGRFLGLDTNALASAFNQTQQKPPELHISSANAASQYHSFKHNSWKVWLKVIPLLLLAGVLAVQIINPNSWLMTQFKAAFVEQSGNSVDGIKSPAKDIMIQIGDRATDTQTTINDSVPPAETAVTQTVPALTSLESLPTEAEQNPTPETGLAPEDQPPMLLAPETAAVQGNEITLSSLPESEESTQTGEPSVETQAPQIDRAAIRLTVSDKNWIEVRDKARKIVQSKIFQKGNEIVLPVEGAPYDLKIGRPDSVSLYVDNQAVSLEAYRVKGNKLLFRVGEEQ